MTEKYKKGGLLAFLLKLDAHINPNNSAQQKIVKAILNQLEETQDNDSHSVKMIPLGKGYSIDTLKSQLMMRLFLIIWVFTKRPRKIFRNRCKYLSTLMRTDIEKQ